MGRINKVQSRAYSISYVAYNGEDDERYFKVVKDKELPSWVKCDSDVIGIMLYLQINRYNEDRDCYDFRSGVLSQIIPYDVCRAIKYSIEDCWVLNKDYMEFLKSQLNKFKTHALTLEDGFFDAYVDEVSGYIGYYTRPNGDVVDINLDKWEDDTKNCKFQNI